MKLVQPLNNNLIVYLIAITQSFDNSIAVDNLIIQPLFLRLFLKQFKVLITQ